MGATRIPLHGKGYEVAPRARDKEQDRESALDRLQRDWVG